ncbi:MAG: hypothetical protein QOG71_3881 [Pyrinomonadaceae bacterium]|nr:hypothetical protein [Pyrinomonadaceae bacterium]
MTATEKKLEALKRTINLISRIARDIQTDDYESLDALMRAASDADADLFELRLELSETGELAQAA